MADLRVTPSSFSARPRLSQADLAYQNLRQAIVMWQVEPGAWLSEADLQVLSGVGRTPTREAAGRLIENALLAVVPRNGYQVADLTERDAAALYDLWESLARLTGERAAGRVDPQTLASLRRLVSEPGAASPEELRSLMEHVFDVVLRATANPWLLRVGKGLFDHLERIWMLSFSEGGGAAASGFEQMLEALVETDPGRAGDRFVEFTARIREHTLHAVRAFESGRATARSRV